MSILNIFDFKPKLKAYANSLIEGLAHEGYTNWRFEPEQKALIHEGGSIVNLVNLHIQYVAARRADRADLIEHCIAICVSMQRQAPRDWNEAAERVRLVVRSRYDMASMEAGPENLRNDFQSTVAWPFVGDLQLRLVYDCGPHVGHVTTDVMQAWSEPESVVKVRAMENMQALATPEWRALATDVFQIDPDVEFAESRMLLDSVIDRLPFKDRVAVSAPNRGVLLAADSDSDSALTTLLEEAIRSLQHKPWPMSGKVFVRHGGNWQVLERNGSIGQLMHKLDALNMSGIYRDQKSAIESHNESTGRDVFVASFAVVEKDGVVFSWSSWTQDCMTLLPQTDIVVLVRNSGEAGQTEHLPVAWKDLERIMGAQMQPIQFSPPRYTVESFPDAVQWDQLEKQRVEL